MAQEWIDVFGVEIVLFRSRGIVGRLRTTNQADIMLR